MVGRIKQSFAEPLKLTTENQVDGNLHRTWLSLKTTNVGSTGDVAATQRSHQDAGQFVGYLHLGKHAGLYREPSEWRKCHNLAWTSKPLNTSICGITLSIKKLPAGLLSTPRPLTHFIKFTHPEGFIKVSGHVHAVKWKNLQSQVSGGWYQRQEWPGWNGEGPKRAKPAPIP